MYNVHTFVPEDIVSAREASHAPVDTMLFILREDGTLVAFSEQRDKKGVSIKKKKMFLFYILYKRNLSAIQSNKMLGR